MEISEREIISLFILSSVCDKRLVGGAKGPVKGGRGQSKRVLLASFGGGGGGRSDPDRISDQKMSFSQPFSDLSKIYSRIQTWPTDIDDIYMYQEN